MQLIFILCLLLPSCWSHTYSAAVYDAIYGDLTLEDLYLPETTEEVTEAEMKNLSKIDVTDLMRDEMLANHQDIYEELKNVTGDGLDAQEYNDISVKMYNFTRKRTYGWSWQDNEDGGYYGWNSVASAIEEKKRILLMEKICLMFLYHSRYKIEKALDKRRFVRKDKRYRLGYLFNRLRRLKTEMRKIVSIAMHQMYADNRKFENLTSIMRLYEGVVRYDVDVRNTMELIKDVHDEPADFDIYYKTGYGGQANDPIFWGLKDGAEPVEMPLNEPQTMLDLMKQHGGGGGDADAG